MSLLPEQGVKVSKIERADRRYQAEPGCGGYPVLRRPFQASRRWELEVPNKERTNMVYLSGFAGSGIV